MSSQDKYELIHEHHVFYDDIKPAKDKDELDGAMDSINLGIAHLNNLSTDIDTTSAKDLLIEAIRRLIIIEQDLKEEE